MPDTPILALPYPVDANTVDVPRDIQALANRLEVLLGDITTSGAVIPVASIISTGRSTAPAGWALCQGQTPSRTDPVYVALFAAIGTTYGVGDGSTTFTLPNLQGRVPIGSGTATGAAGATAHTLGQKLGEEAHTLTAAEIAAHTHQYIPPSVVPGAAGAGFANIQAGSNYSSSLMVGDLTLIPTMASRANTGGDGSHNNMPPYQTVNYMIKL